MVRNYTIFPERLCCVGVSILFFASYMGNRVISLGHITLLIALVVFIVRFLIGSRENGEFCSDLRCVLKRHYRISTICLGGLIIVYVLSIMWNWKFYENPFLDLKKIRYLLIAILLIIVLDGIPIATLRRLFKWCVAAWLISLILAGSYGLIMNFKLTPGNPVVMNPGTHLQKAELVPLQLARVGGIFGNVMSFAYSLQFSFLLLCSFLLNWNKPEVQPLRRNKGIVLLICAGILIAGLNLYFTFTRGAVLGVVVGLFSMVLLQRSWKLLSVIMLVGILGGAYSYKNDGGFFRSLKNESVRVSQWRTAGLTFLAYPEFGVGYRNFEKRCADLKKEFGMPFDVGEGRTQWYKGHAHNNYLEAFASTGFPGGILFVGFVCFWFVEVFRSKVAKQYFIPVIVAFAVSGLFENTFTDSEVLSFILLIYVSSQLALDKEHRAKEARAVSS